jgi:hypothetical protein
MTSVDVVERDVEHRRVGGLFQLEGMVGFGDDKGATADDYVGGERLDGDRVIRSGL